MMSAQPAEPDPAHEQSLERGPTALRIALGTQLRRLREQCRISREDAGESIRASHAKISRLELGQVRFKERDLRDLLTLYRVTDPADREKVLDLARQANTPGWWHGFGDVLPAWFETYIGLEQAAGVVRSYEVQFIPGLLQTPEYARAVVRLGHGGAASEEVDRRVELRMRRQEVLDRADAPTLWVVIDEAALRRPIGGNEILRAQIDQLVEACERPNVQIQLLPYTAGGHAAAGGPFSILRFEQPELPDIVYLEQLTSALYLDKRADVDQYMQVMDRLSIQAQRPEHTPQLLRALRAYL